MTVELVFRFPLGRVHATPWGENQNEGGVEWPPSPWRLLRALYATWRSRVPDLDGAIVLSVLDELAEPPQFILPRHGAAHTRHYLPGPAHKQGVATDTSKTLDAFVTVDPDDELIIRWPADLDDAGREALTVLAEHLTYLGRAESICDVTARFESTPSTVGVTAQLADEDPSPSISLLTPERPVVEEALTVTTTHVRAKLKRREPPATRRFRYTRPESGPEIRAMAGSRRHTDKVTTFRWSIASTARPSKYAAVAWADTLRQAVFSKYGGPDKRQPPSVLSGKHPDGQLTNAHHGHVHWFAFGDSGDRLLSTLVAWAPTGFGHDLDDGTHMVDEEILDAMANVRFLRSKGISDVHSCAVGVEGWGQAADIIPELVGPSRSWRSYTPFAPSRHRHKNSGEDEQFYSNCITEELRWRDRVFENLTAVVKPTADWHHFRRHRPNKERLDQARRVAGLEIEFPDVVEGPLALGALSHFGLGLFVPIGE